MLLEHQKSKKNASCKSSHKGKHNWAYVIEPHPTYVLTCTIDHDHVHDHDNDHDPTIFLPAPFSPFWSLVEKITIQILTRVFVYDDIQTD